MARLSPPWGTLSCHYTTLRKVGKTTYHARYGNTLPAKLQGNLTLRLRSGNVLFVSLTLTGGELLAEATVCYRTAISVEGQAIASAAVPKAIQELEWYKERTEPAPPPAAKGRVLCVHLAPLPAHSLELMDTMQANTSNPSNCSALRCPRCSCSQRARCSTRCSSRTRQSCAPGTRWPS